MVKFGKYLSISAIPEWRSKYLDYKALKKILKRLTQRGQRQVLGTTEADDGNFPRNIQVLTDTTGRAFMVNISDSPAKDDLFESLESLMPAHIVHHDIELAFFRFLQSEIEKVFSFFSVQEQFLAAQVEAMAIKARLKKISCRDKRFHDHKFRLTCQWLFQGLQHLQNFHVINYVAIAKILKKHDKLSSWTKSKDVIMPLLSNPERYPRVDGLDKLMKKVQDEFVSLYASGNHSLGVDMLRIVPKKMSHGTSFVAGVTVGLLLALIGVIATVFLLSPQQTIPSEFLAAFPTFRFLVQLVFALTIWGIDIAIFSSKQINYGFIMNADPNSLLRSNQIILIAASSFVLVLSCLTIFLVVTFFSTNSRIPPGYFHLFAFLVLLLILFCPFDILFKPTRTFLLSTLFCIVISPFSSVQFQTFFLADFLTSMVRVFYDLNYAMCFYVTGDFLSHTSDVCLRSVSVGRWVLAFLPYWWRFAQCLRRFHDSKQPFPHLANAAKYASALMVTFFSLLADSYRSSPALLGVWIGAAIFGTIFSYSWDIFMDWGLLEQDSPNFLLRSKLLFSPWVYYVAAVTNLLLRVTWVFTISPNSTAIVNHEVLLLALSIGEILRRGQWVIFRVENEHLNNCGKFRIVNEIPLEMAYDPACGENGSRGPDEDDADDHRDLLRTLPILPDAKSHRSDDS